MNLTDIFSFNKTLHIPTFEKNNISATYDTNFGKHYNKDFSRKVVFNDDSKSLINNTKLFEKDFHRKDNTNELTNVINSSKSEMTELNPQYKYRFPQYTEDQFKLMQWQTQEGTPNELNQRLRSDVNDANLEDIKNDDNSYESGLQTLREKMSERRKQLYKEFEEETNRIKKSDATPEQKEIEQKKLEEEKDTFENQFDEEDKKSRRAANRKNPIKKYAKKSNVIIQPAIPKQPKINPPKIKPAEQIHQENFKKIFNKVKNLDLYLDKSVQHKANKEDKDNNKKDTNKEFLNKIEKQNKEIANHEKVALITIDDIINELKDSGAKKLTANKRKEVNEKLKEVDGSNIGAIKNIDTAVRKLEEKKRSINESKEIIKKRRQASTEADRKISRSVPKNPNIVNVANYPANDDESDFSVNKLVKSNPPKTAGKNK